MTEVRDRIVELRVSGMRSLADVRLPLGGLTVLIGDNGTGKSTVLEALEILRKIASVGELFMQLGSFHGGLRGSLLRYGSSALLIGARFAGGGPPIEYSITLFQQGPALLIAEEHLDLWPEADAPEPLRVIDRVGSEAHVFDVTEGVQKPLQFAWDPAKQSADPVLPIFGAMAQPAIARVLDGLRSSQIYAPFEVAQPWAANDLTRKNPLREPAQLRFMTRELDRLGQNLANCYYALSNEFPKEVWQRTLERVRAGLGLDVTEIRFPPVGPGQIELGMEFHGLPRPISVKALSDGQLTYLAFVAIAELGGQRGFLAFDEPETHLHPGLLVRVTWLLEELARSCPVIIATHSDRLLDALSEPASSVVLCELDEHRSTRFLRPAPEALAAWLEKYRGIGALREEGYERHVLTEPVETSR
jgi:predicted ATPase